MLWASPHVVALLRPPPLRHFSITSPSPLHPLSLRGYFGARTALLGCVAFLGGDLAAPPPPLPTRAWERGNRGTPASRASASCVLFPHPPPPPFHLPVPSYPSLMLLALRDPRAFRGRGQSMQLEDGLSMAYVCAVAPSCSTSHSVSNLPFSQALLLSQSLNLSPASRCVPAFRSLRPCTGATPYIYIYIYIKGLSFISNRQRRKEGTFCASELAGIEPTPPAPKGSGYVRVLHDDTSIDSDIMPVVQTYMIS